MKKIYLFMLVLITWGCNTRLHTQKMPATSNDLYAKFSKAVQTYNLNDLEAVMCKASMVRLKNQALSMGMNYPKDVLEEMSVMLLDQADLSYLNFKKLGRTTNVYYMYGKNKAESNIITLCLLEEEDGSIKLEQIKMRDAKDFIINLNKKDYSFLELKEFAPTGLVPAIPKEVIKVDYMASIDIVSYGYKLLITVNGFLQDEIVNTTRNGVLIGGVNKGENTINIIVEKVDMNEQDNPAISIKKFEGGAEKEVFVIYEPMQGYITKTFYVE